jgi:hypothetical protein
MAKISVLAVALLTAGAVAASAQSAPMATYCDGKVQLMGFVSSTDTHGATNDSTYAAWVKNTTSTAITVAVDFRSNNGNLKGNPYTAKSVPGLKTVMLPFAKASFEKDSAGRHLFNNNELGQMTKLVCSK